MTKLPIEQYAYAARLSCWEAKNPNHTHISYWKGHYELHDYMEGLWIKKGKPGINSLDEDSDYCYHYFHGVELELNWNDLNFLEKRMSSKFYRSFNINTDLDFIATSRMHLFFGLRVFYLAYA